MDGPTFGLFYNYVSEFMDDLGDPIRLSYAKEFFNDFTTINTDLLTNVVQLQTNEELFSVDKENYPKTFWLEFDTYRNAMLQKISWNWKE